MTPVGQKLNQYNIHHSSDFSDRTDSDEENIDPGESDTVDTEARVFSGMLPFKVTRRDVEFAETWAATLRKMYEEDIRNNAIRSEPNEENYLAPGEGKVEISKGCRFYIDADIVRDLKNIARIGKFRYDWKKLLKGTLLEVYDNSISHHCATGYRKNSKPLMKRRLFNGLYELTEDVIKRKTYLKYINGISGNKSRHREHCASSRTLAESQLFATQKGLYIYKYSFI